MNTRKKIVSFLIAVVLTLSIVLPAYAYGGFMPVSASNCGKTGSFVQYNGYWWSHKYQYNYTGHSGNVYFYQVKAYTRPNPWSSYVYRGTDSSTCFR